MGGIEVNPVMDDRQQSPIKMHKQRSGKLILGSNYQLTNTGVMGRQHDQNSNNSPSINPYTETINVRTNPALMLVVN